MLPDFRVRQRDYLLEIARLLTQELDLEKLLERIHGKPEEKPIAFLMLRTMQKAGFGVPSTEY